MSDLQKLKNFDMLRLALTEKNRQKRYAFLNAVAESAKHSSHVSERGFASVCYELNGEPYTASQNLISLSNLDPDDDYLFVNTCIKLQQKDLEGAKNSFAKAVLSCKQSNDYSDLGLLAAIQKALLQKQGRSCEEYFKNIALPSISVIKVFTSDSANNFTEEQLKIAEAAAEEFKSKSAMVISCCGNQLEQRMLSVILGYGIRVICAPLVSPDELPGEVDMETRNSLASICQRCELLDPITDYSDAFIPGEDIWQLVEDYSAQYLLGLAIMKREETGLPISCFFADFSNRHAAENLMELCVKNEITNVKNGVQNA